jgi:hypothetical protein
MNRTTALFLSLIIPALVTGAHAAPREGETVEAVIRDLNATKSVKASDDVKSYPVLFDAYLQLDPPPMPIDASFNLRTIHPGMSKWDLVAGWAESGPEMAAALVRCHKENLTVFGLPYGLEGVKTEYRDAGLTVEIGAEGSLRDNRFHYLGAIRTIAAYATAEIYRRFEAGQVDEAIQLLYATCFMLRQCADREFLGEVMEAIPLITQMLGNARDMFYVYFDKISADQFREIALDRVPYLRPDRQRLLMPEGDRRVAEALISEVFDPDGPPDREKFAAAFASVQSADAPLTRFGAARRWRMVAEVHDSRTASLERLELVYNDWWRRWRVEEYDPILDIPTEFERTNPVRYAAVIYSMESIEDLFGIRNQLIGAVHGTGMAAGLCGYKKFYGVYPATSDMTYAQFSRKRLDRDPYDPEFLPFKYRVLTAPLTIDVGTARVRVEKDECVLYSKGLNQEDDRAEQHAVDGLTGDIVVWPPITALMRREGLLD